MAVLRRKVCIPPLPGGALPARTSHHICRSFRMTSLSATAPRALPPAFVDTLSSAFGTRFSTTEAIRAHHGHDESHFPDALPDAVVFPRNTEEVVTIVTVCAE